MMRIIAAPVVRMRVACSAVSRCSRLALVLWAGLDDAQLTKLLQVSPDSIFETRRRARVVADDRISGDAGAVLGGDRAPRGGRRGHPRVGDTLMISRPARWRRDRGAAAASEDPLADVRIVAPGYSDDEDCRWGRFLTNAMCRPGTSVSTRRWRAVFGASPLGRIIQNPHGKVVVGGVGDVDNQGLEQEPKKQVYPARQQAPTAGMALVARTERDAASFGNAIQRAIWEVDPGQPIYELSTMDQILARAVFLPRLSTTLLATFALAALLLAALGIYGVLSYSVSHARRRSACAWLSARLVETRCDDKAAAWRWWRSVRRLLQRCLRGRWPESSMASDHSISIIRTLRSTLCADC